MKKLLLLLLLPFLLFSAPSPKGKRQLKLGELSQIASTTSDLNATITYWKKLGFRVVFQDKTPAPWVQMTDESILLYFIQVDQRFIRLAYFTSDYAGKLQDLKKAKIKFKSEENDASGKPWRAVFDSPDGQEISIVNRNPGMMFHPTAKTMFTMDQKDMANPENMPTKLGMFGEFCHKVSNLKESVAYWEKLGFKSTGINTEPYPWAIMSDGMSLIGLHETKDWEGSAIAYFAPDMGKRIEALKAEGIEGREIGMGPANVVIDTPEGVQLFLFSLF